MEYVTYEQPYKAKSNNSKIVEKLTFLGSVASVFAVASVLIPHWLIWFVATFACYLAERVIHVIAHPILDLKDEHYARLRVEVLDKYSNCRYHEKVLTGNKEADLFEDSALIANLKRQEKMKLLRKQVASKARSEVAEDHPEVFEHVSDRHARVKASSSYV